MLPTKRTDALTPSSLSDYLTLAAREPVLPPSLGDFLALLANVKADPVPAVRALAAVIRHLQADPPEGPSIRLWLLVAYAPALQALAVRYRTPGATLDESASAAVWAFLETLQAMSVERLASPWLAREIERDTKDRLRVVVGARDYQQDARRAERPDEALMEDRVRDERTDAYQALEDLIQDMPVTEAERTLLSGLYVYGYTLREMADMAGEAYNTVQKRFYRLMRRLENSRRFR
ncbi:MAG: sigma-70 family RNA polymerase sigma factor [bacterium]|nr:sigma-70 family RNA polymerase sigma factor [bacterium]